MIRIGICEDDLEQLETCRNFVGAVMMKLTGSYKIYCFQSGENLLCEIEASGAMDIILMDIEMQGINGVETARRIRERDSRAKLVFISTHDQYFREIIEVQPFSFLEKPIDGGKLERILSSIVDEKQREDCYRFSWNKVQYSVPLSEIRYFQSDKRVIQVSLCRPDEPVAGQQFYGKLSDIEKALGLMETRFLRIRKSCLVNPRYIAEYRANQIVLDTGDVMEISRQYKDQVREYYITLLKGKVCRYLF